MADSAGELRLRLEAGPEAMAALAARAGRVTAAVKRALSDSVNLVHRKITLNISGAVLRVKTGRLRQSMQTFVAGDGSSGGVGTNVEYARIHEFGGQTRPHDILPTRAGALRFVGSRFIGPIKMTKKGKIARVKNAGAAGSGIVFAGGVLHPGSNIPARPYMRPALEDSREDINRIFVSRLAAALKGKG